MAGGAAAGPTAADDARVAALEQRVDALLARLPATAAAAVPATLPLERRDAVDTATPALVDAVVALRDAVLQLAGATLRPMPTTPATGTAGLQAVLATATKTGVVEGSDLLLLTVPQVVARLGSPKRVEPWRDGHMQLVYELQGRQLRISVLNGCVTQAYVSEPSR